MPAFEWSLDPGYRIEVFADQDAVSGADVVELWTRDAKLSAAEAERRVEELLLLATDERGGLAGLCTAYLRHNRQLRSKMWFIRVFVAAAHRQSNVARALAVRAREHLERRFLSGEDARAIGVIYEVESRMLRTHVLANWRATDALFIGENARGDHVRVKYFPGALAPEPDVPG